jgi:S1-C subfamily serine protease
MKKSSLFVLFFLAIAFMLGCDNHEEKDKIEVSLPAQNNNNQVDWQAIYQANIQSVPMVVFEKCYLIADYCTDYGHGTGFVVDDYVVATNLHVAEYFFLEETSTVPADTIYYQVYAKYPENNTPDNNYFLPEKYYVTGVYPMPERDLALLEVDTLGNTPVMFTPDNFNGLAIDDEVMIVSYPGSNYFVGSTGKISGLVINNGWVDWVIDDTKIIEYTADTFNGSSGGPVFNIWGEVIGIDFAFYLNEQNEIIPLAISIDHLKNIDFPNLVFETQ